MKINSLVFFMFICNFIRCEIKENYLEFIHLEFLVLNDEKVWQDGTEKSVLTLIKVRNFNENNINLFSGNDSLIIKIVKDDSVLFKTVLDSDNFNSTINILPNDSSYICFFFHKDISYGFDEIANNSGYVFNDVLANSKVYYELHYEINEENAQKSGVISPYKVSSCPKYSKFLCMDEDKYLNVYKYLYNLK